MAIIALETEGLNNSILVNCLGRAVLGKTQFYSRNTVIELFSSFMARWSYYMVDERGNIIWLFCQFLIKNMTHSEYRVRARCSVVWTVAICQKGKKTCF